MSHGDASVARSWQRWNERLAMRAGLVGCYNGAKIKMPDTVRLLADGGQGPSLTPAIHVALSSINIEYGLSLACVLSTSFHEAAASMLCDTALRRGRLERVHHTGPGLRSMYSACMHYVMFAQQAWGFASCHSQFEVSVALQLTLLVVGQSVQIVPEPTDPTELIDVIKGEVWNIPWVLEGESQAAVEASPGHRSYDRETDFCADIHLRDARLLNAMHVVRL